MLKINTGKQSTMNRNIFILILENIKLTRQNMKANQTTFNIAVE